MCWEKRRQLFQAEMPDKIPATTDANMKVLFAMFSTFLVTGADTHLSLECHAWQAWLHLRVHLAHQPHQVPQQQRKPGPSRHRRRTPRTLARVAGEKVTAENSNGENDSNVECGRKFHCYDMREMAMQDVTSPIVHHIQAEKLSKSLHLILNKMM